MRQAIEASYHERGPVIMTFRYFAQALAVVPISVLIFSAGAQSATYNEVTVSEAGRISGKVTFEGELPADAVEQIAITKNPEVCGEGYREIVWVDVNDGALRGSFVFIEKIAEGKPWPQPEGGHYMIRQKNCRFAPWAQVIKPGRMLAVIESKVYVQRDGEEILCAACQGTWAYLDRSR